MQKLRIAFMTLGCKVNYYETEKLTEQFASKGNIIVPFSEYADVYVVNTCTVTAIADRKSRKMLHRARKLNENAVIAAMGCFAQTKKDTLCQEENIDIVVYGHSHKSNIYEDKGILYINPGSVGPRRFNLPISMAKLKILDNERYYDSLKLIDKNIYRYKCYEVEFIPIVI